MIETSWLRAFAAFADDANLSRTARRLHLSQPAVHAQIRKLSEELGTTLYRRVGRALVLTREGMEVAAFARDLDQRTRDLAARMRGEVEPDRLVLAAGAGALLYVVGEGLRDFTRRRSTRVELLTLDAPAALDAVRSGLAHVGVAASEEAPADLVCRSLTRVEQVLVVPRSHRLASRRSISLDQVAGERFVLPPEGRPHRVMLEAALRMRGIRVEVGAIARGWELTLKLVELGFGIAIVNGCCHVAKGLVARPVRELPVVEYVTFTRGHPSPLTAALVQALAEHGDDWRIP
jgi:LysR family transcriptional regulator, low CO2-responsive transcriptional regulator